jgi:hypothetical protein
MSTRFLATNLREWPFGGKTPTGHDATNIAALATAIVAMPAGNAGAVTIY